MKPQDNPFYTGDWCGHPTFITGAGDRIEEVKDFTVEQCQAALNVRGLQQSVIDAIHRRLKKLGASHESSTH